MTKPAQQTMLQRFAAVRRLVGPALLPVVRGERATAVTYTPEGVHVMLSVVREVPVRGGTKVTHRGTKWYSFIYDSVTGKWSRETIFESLDKLPSPEYSMSYGVVTEAEYRERKAHEEMCYRPGNRSWPLDGPVRLAQLREHGTSEAQTRNTSG